MNFPVVFKEFHNFRRFAPKNTEINCGKCTPLRGEITEKHPFQQKKQLQKNTVLE